MNINSLESPNSASDSSFTRTLKDFSEYLIQIKVLRFEEPLIRQHFR